MAEVEIHGDQGDLRTLSGRPARWRQQLVRDPNSTGGVAVIRIEDQQGSREGYTGAIRWRGGSNNWGGVGNWATGGYLDDRWDQKITQSAAMNICRIQVVATGNGSRSKVRVQHGADPGNGSYLINHQARQKNGKITTGACRVSPIGENEAFQWW